MGKYQRERGSISERGRVSECVSERERVAVSAETSQGVRVEILVGFQQVPFVRTEQTGGFLREIEREREREKERGGEERGREREGKRERGREG